MGGGVTSLHLSLDHGHFTSAESIECKLCLIAPVHHALSTLCWVIMQIKKTELSLIRMFSLFLFTFKTLYKHKHPLLFSPLRYFKTTFLVYIFNKSYLNYNSATTYCLDLEILQRSTMDTWIILVSMVSSHHRISNRLFP